jgi:hypothetical protein
MLQQEARSIDPHHWPLQARPSLLHFRPELLDHAIHDFPDYQFRYFLPRWTIAPHGRGGAVDPFPEHVSVLAAGTVQRVGRVHVQT